MTIKELIKKELLKRVKVKRPADVVMASTKKKSKAVSKKLNGLNLNCADISICSVEAMRDIGENDWNIVPGYTFNPEDNKPLRHVWVRKGQIHYDPYWSDLYVWNIEKLAYYKIVKPLNVPKIVSETNAADRIVNRGNRILKELKRIADEWKLELGGYLY